MDHKEDEIKTCASVLPHLHCLSNPTLSSLLNLRYVSCTLCQPSVRSYVLTDPTPDLLNGKASPRRMLTGTLCAALHLVSLNCDVRDAHVTFARHLTPEGPLFTGRGEIDVAAPAV